MWAIFSATDPQHCYAQTIRAEPLISYEYGYPLIIERAPGIINHFSTDGVGSSFEHTIGVGVALAMPDLFSETVGLTPMLQYRFGIGKFTSQSYLSLEYNAQKYPIETSNHFEVTSSQQMFDLSLPFRFQLGRVGLTVGPWLSIDLAKSITGTEYIDTPASARYLTGGTSEKFANGDTIASNAVHGGFEIGALYRIPLSSTLALEPRAFGRVDLGAIQSVASKAYSVGLSVTLSPIPTHEEHPPVKFDTVVVYCDTVQPTLSTEVHFTRNGTRTSKHTPIDVIGYRTHLTQYTELKSQIEFARSSADIPSQYADPNPTITLSTLARADLSDFSKQLLNIIGYRLTKDTESVLQLQMTNDGSTIQRERLDHIKRYFTNGWHIDPSRITMLPPTHHDVKAEKTVTLSSRSLMTPVATQWIENSYHIPHLGLEKMIAASAGLRSWQVSVMQGNKILAHFTNAEAASETAISDFDLVGDSTADTDRIAEPLPLVATLEAVDFSGHRIASYDTLLLPDRAEQKKNVIAREVYSFIFLNPAPITASEEEYASLMIKKLLAVVKDGAHITIEEPPHSIMSEQMTITERIVSEFARRHAPHPDIHIMTNTSHAVTMDDYSGAVVVRVEQAGE